MNGSKIRCGSASVLPLPRGVAWNLAGSYSETCSCELMCPCNTSFDHGATYDFCRVTLAFSIHEGSVDDVDIAGRKVVLIADTPKVMTDGNWRVGVFIDDEASEPQFDKLVQVFGGQLGGPMAGLAPLIGEMLGVQRATIDIVESLETSGELPKYIDQETLLKETLAEALGLGPLDDLLNDEQIDTIIVDRRDRVIVGKDGQLRSSGRAFSSDEMLEKIIKRLVVFELGQRLDESTSIIDARWYRIQPDAVSRPSETVGRIRCCSWSVFIEKNDDGGGSPKAWVPAV